MSTIRRLDSTGDTLLAEWTDTDTISTEKAKVIFDEMVAQGLLVSRCDPGTDLSGEKATVFDPAAEDYIVHPRPVGG